MNPTDFFSIFNYCMSGLPGIAPLDKNLELQAFISHAHWFLDK